MTTSEETEMRQLLRLMRDACLLSSSHEDKRRKFVSGLGGLIGADFAEWVESSDEAGTLQTERELHICCKPVGKLLFSRHTKRPFSQREILLAGLMATEFPWLPAPVFNGEAGLTRRERLTLEFLLQSYGRKAIAKKLGISLNTVNGYIKAIYRNFGVHSHAELLRHYFNTRGTEPVVPGEAGGLPQGSAAAAV